MNIDGSFHVFSVVDTGGLYAVVNKLTKCLVTGCKQKKILEGWEISKSSNTGIFLLSSPETYTLPDLIHLL